MSANPWTPSSPASGFGQQAGFGSFNSKSSGFGPQGSYNSFNSKSSDKQSNVFPTTADILCMSSLPDKDIVAAGLESGDIFVIQKNNEKWAESLIEPATKNPITAICILLDSKGSVIILAGTSKGQINLFSLGSNSPVLSGQHEGIVTSICALTKHTQNRLVRWSRRAAKNYFFSSGTDGHICLWEVPPLPAGGQTTQSTYPYSAGGQASASYSFTKTTYSTSEPCLLQDIPVPANYKGPIYLSATKDFLFAAICQRAESADADCVLQYKVNPDSTINNNPISTYKHSQFLPTSISTSPSGIDFVVGFASGAIMINETAKQSSFSQNASMSPQYYPLKEFQKEHSNYSIPEKLKASITEANAKKVIEACSINAVLWTEKGILCAGQNGALELFDSTSKTTKNTLKMPGGDTTSIVALALCRSCLAVAQSYDYMLGPNPPPDVPRSHRIVLKDISQK